MERFTAVKWKTASTFSNTLLLVSQFTHITYTIYHTGNIYGLCTNNKKTFNNIHLIWIIFMKKNNFGCSFHFFFLIIFSSVASSNSYIKIHEICWCWVLNCSAAAHWWDFHQMERQKFHSQRKKKKEKKIVMAEYTLNFGRK